MSVKMVMRKTGIIGLLFMGALSAPLRAQQTPPPVLVEVAEAEAELMAPQVYMPGTVVSRNDSRIAAEIAGRVTWVAAEGALVAEGDVVAEIDARDLKIVLERNRSEVKRLEARVAFLRADLARLSDLAARDAVSASRLEDAESTMHMTDEQLAQARLAVEQSELDMERTKVRAPFPGRVVARLAQAGEYSSPGRQIVRLVDTEHLEVIAQVPVAMAEVLRDGATVMLRHNDVVSDTVIRALVPVGDTVSRTMEIRVRMPEGKQLFVGTAVQVGLAASAPEQVVAVPRDALVLRRDGTYVFRIDADGKAERLLVTTGSATGARVAVSGGINAGDSVVIRGAERLRPGQAVQVRATGTGR